MLDSFGLLKSLNLIKENIQRTRKANEMELGDYKISDIPFEYPLRRFIHKIFSIIFILFSKKEKKYYRAIETNKMIDKF